MPSKLVTMPTPPRAGSRCTFWFIAKTGVTKPNPTSEMLCAGAVSMASPLYGPRPAITLAGRLPSGFVLEYVPGLPEEVEYGPGPTDG